MLIDSFFIWLFHRELHHNSCVDFKVRTLDLGETSVKLKIWDTAGQERFRNIATTYYRDADGFMIVFDKTDRDSFQNTDGWMDEVNRHANEHAIKMLVETNQICAIVIRLL
ncbi:unnamed protein product [Blepharisma stoltei]|uniref:Uncharacterized protein n=1 Tax=Blepharisma stoltei TaxID=1481888 RepID=A0AAU9JY79_9CILI|nr:unnamed protein product [Blepharisma stoltei]